METQRAIEAIVLPVIAFAVVIGVAFAFGMFLHLFPKAATPGVALLAVLLVTIGAAVISSRVRTTAATH